MLHTQEEWEATTVISQGLCGIDGGAAGPGLGKLRCCVTGTIKRRGLF